jgi:hypothetical protein
MLNTKQSILTYGIAIVLLLGFQKTMGQSNGNFSYPPAFDLHPHLTERINELSNHTPSPDPPSHGVTENGISLQGYLSLPDHPIADVWAHGDYAYVAGWGENTTVKVVNIKDPSNPQVAATIPSMNPGTSPQDVKVTRINTRYFHGDLLVVGNDGFFTGGIQLFNVSDPENPQLLSTFPVNLVHNVFPYQKGNRAFVLLALPTRELFNFFFPWFPGISPGEFMIVEITDPTNPQMVSEWAAGADGGFGFGIAGLPPNNCTDCRGSFFPSVNLHDVWANEQGTVAYLAYWDLGLVILDISNPEAPELISQTREPVTFGSDQGDAHVAVPAKGGNLVLVGDETFYDDTFSPVLPWGFLRIFDTSDPYNPVQVGAFATPNTLTNTDQDRWSSMHNVIVRGNRAFISWYNEGLRVIDFTDPSNPKEIASYIVEPDPINPSQFWGVHVNESLILASDVAGALYIFKLKAGGQNHASMNTANLKQALSNYPNPFQFQTNVRFLQEKEGRISLNIFDSNGKQIINLMEGSLPVGQHEFRWDGKNQLGEAMPPGVYIARLKSDQLEEIKSFRLILSK